MARFDGSTTGRGVIQAMGSQAAGKTILVTGPSEGGIGAEIAKTLASANPSELLLVGRNEAKVAPVIEQIRAANPSVNVTCILCDLADNSSVREAAALVNSVVDSIHVLVNNAGIMARPAFTKTADGVEIQFATCHLGHFLLTNLIMDKLVAALGVVVNISSSGYTYDAVDTQDPNFNEGKDYNPWMAYGRAKTANILFSVAIAERFGYKGVASFAVDPGMVGGTNIMANSGADIKLMQQRVEIAVARNGGKPLPPYQKVGVQQGCAGAVLASLDTSLRESSPAFLEECAIVPTLPYASDKDIAEKLWKLSEKLVGQAFDP